MKNNILKTNMIILLVYSVIIMSISFLQSGQEKGLAVAIYLAFAICIQFIINFIAAVVSLFNRRELSGSYFLSAFLVLLIGCPVCFGGAGLIK